MAISQESARRRRLVFMQAYLADPAMNGSAAAIKAGISVKRARVFASETLRDPEVKAMIEAEMAARSERTKIDADYVLREADRIYRLAIKVAEDKETAGTILAARSALELIGKHVGVQAFKEKTEVEVGDKLADLIAKSLKTPGGA